MNIFVGDKTLSGQSGTVPMNLMTSDPQKVWPKGIVYYQFHDRVCKLN